MIIGAGKTTCLVLALGARIDSVGENWGGYTVEAAAARHGASVEEETSDPKLAYAKVARWQRSRFREGWLPG